MTIGDKIASIVAFFLPRRVKYYATLDWLDWLPVEVMIIEDRTYTATIRKESK